MNIPLCTFKTQYRHLKPVIDSAIQEVLDSGSFILGKHVEQIVIKEEKAKDIIMKDFNVVTINKDTLIIEPKIK